MNVVYRTQFVETEYGIERPDGVAYAFRKEVLERVPARRSYNEPSRRRGPVQMCLVNPDLSKKIHDNGGIFTTIERDDPGMLGQFVSNNPQANLELYRKRMAEATLTV